VEGLQHQLGDQSELLDQASVKKAPGLALARLAVDIDAMARKLEKARAALTKASARGK
jgi:hypothetical protein